MLYDLMASAFEGLGVTFYGWDDGPPNWPGIVVAYDMCHLTDEPVLVVNVYVKQKLVMMLGMAEGGDTISAGYFHGWNETKQENVWTRTIYHLADPQCFQMLRAEVKRWLDKT